MSTFEFFKHEGVELRFSDNFCATSGMNKMKELIAGKIKRKEFQSKLKSEFDHFFVMASGSFMINHIPSYLLKCERTMVFAAILQLRCNYYDLCRIG